jgi:hypothetical protein
MFFCYRTSCPEISPGTGEDYTRWGRFEYRSGPKIPDSSSTMERDVSPWEDKEVSYYRQRSITPSKEQGALSI